MTVTKEDLEAMELRLRQFILDVVSTDDELRFSPEQRAIAAMGSPRAQAEARLRDDLRRALIDWINIESPFVVIGPPDAQQRARHDLRRAVEAILAAPPEPQAPPPDRAAWREEARRVVSMATWGTSDKRPMGVIDRVLDAPLRWPVAGDEGLRELREMIDDDLQRLAKRDPPGQEMDAYSLGFKNAQQYMKREIDRLLSRAASAAREPKEAT